MSNDKKETFKGGYKTTHVSNSGVKTEKVYENGKYIFSSDKLKSKTETKKPR